MIFCIFVIGFDLIYGHMGQLSFGHMLYMGAGAYGAAMFAYFVSPDPFLALGCGILTALSRLCWGRWCRPRLRPLHS